MSFRRRRPSMDESGEADGAPASPLLSPKSSPKRLRSTSMEKTVQPLSLDDNVELTEVTPVVEEGESDNSAGSSPAPAPAPALTVETSAAAAAASAAGGSEAGEGTSKARVLQLQEMRPQATPEPEPLAGSFILRAGASDSPSLTPLRAAGAGAGGGAGAGADGDEAPEGEPVAVLGAGAGGDDLEAGSAGSPAKSVASPVARHRASSAQAKAAAVAPKTMCCGIKYSTKHYEVGPYAPEVYWNDRTQMKNEILAGLTVALAQVSESIAFAFIAGVGPLQGLHAAWIIGLSLSLWGSRPGMINGATGVRAAVIAPYIKQHGVEMMFYIVCVISVFQAAASLLRLAKFVRLIPRPAMIGFVNGLAIILAMGQIGQFQIAGQPGVWLSGAEIGWMWFVVAITVAASVLLPRIPKVGKVLPPSLLGILAATLAEHLIVRPAGYHTPLIENVGKVDGGFPKFFFADPQYTSVPPLDWNTIAVATPPAFIAAAAGMVEAVMTMEVVNDLTETNNPRPNQQLFALSVGNFVSGLLGTMGGGATIGLSMINCTNGANGRYRVSGVVAAVCVLLMILVASPLIKIIPTASLVGIMVIVCYHTFEWSSVPTVLVSLLLPSSVRRHRFINQARKIRRSDAIVIIIVTVVTLLVDLFTAVAAGILFTAAAYAWESGHQLRGSSIIVTDEDGTERKVIRIDGPLFFASTTQFLSVVKPSADDPEEVEIHFHASQIADFSGMHALNVVAEQYKNLGKRVHLKHLNAASYKLLDKATMLTNHFQYQQAEEIAEEVPIQAPHHFHVTSNRNIGV